MMLDSDLAKLYGCKNGTKRINEIVKINIDRFPKKFYFQLTNAEYKNLVLKSQTVTSKLNGSGGLRKMLHVLTEQGVAMLATALKTANATKVSI